MVHTFYMLPEYAKVGLMPLNFATAEFHPRRKKLKGWQKKRK